jgi:hypothetical protein
MKGLIDGIIATLSPAFKDKAWFFKGPQYIRYDFRADKADLGFPRSASSWGPQISGGIDRACDGRGKFAGKAYIFESNQYFRYDYATDKIDAGPSDIAAWGLAPSVSHDVDFSTGIDAVVKGAGPFANKVCFFKGKRYCRYDWTADSMEAEASLAVWNLPGVFSSGVDAAVTGLGAFSSKAYFFRLEFWELNGRPEWTKTMRV